MHPHSDAQNPPPGCPAHDGGGDGGRIPLHGPEFAADPQAFYEHLRKYGPAADVELAPGVDAVLVTEYAAALKVLQNTDLFARDSRRWRALNDGEVPPNSPVLPMLAYRPNCLFSDGAEHMRLRQAVTDSLARVDTHRLSRHVEHVSAYLVNQFCERGTADLLAEYAKLVSLLVFNELFGCPADIGDRLVSAMSDMFDGVNAEEANAELTQSLLSLVTLKRRQPDEDVTSWLMRHHAGLSDEEMVHQLVTLLGGGTAPTQNLIVNAMRLLLADERYSGGHHGAGLLVEDAINEVLWNSPPLANYAAHYPTRDVDLGGVPLQAGDLVMVSFAAANTDPALSASRYTFSKRAHLAWGAGPHACPAKDPAQLIAVTAIEKLLNRLPDVELAVPADLLVWRQGAFHRALQSLPARFAPSRPEGSPANSVWRDGVRVAPTAASAPAAPPEKPAKSSWWSTFLSWRRQ
ncbi:cytochrome P450 [Streptomyces chumphonensis]|uniref:Cytochrome P450 n=1 Tax=Streptomyces chumphonensis TaxID=1214925 RepID=A0A927EWZ5_9ACTN|nr:cytochrome P450 [Streptomyces chumphonensis]MBD3930277.1 cytochrome P450 [Streptomyces chumphonensis]